MMELPVEPGETGATTTHLPPDTYGVTVVRLTDVPGGRFRKFLTIVEIVEVPPGDPVEVRLRPQP